LQRTVVGREGSANTRFAWGKEERIWYSYNRVEIEIKRKKYQ
jgi:hypothetical protein